MEINEIRSKTEEYGIIISPKMFIALPFLNEKIIPSTEDSLLEKTDTFNCKEKPLLTLTDTQVSKEILETIFLKGALPFCTNKDGAVEMNIYLEWLAKVGREALEKMGTA